MRSCLIRLLVMAVFVFALLWFGLPFGASWLATNALNAAGFTGTGTQVDISATLPPRILLGHADKIRLSSTQVSVGDLNAATMDVTLSNVQLIDRTFGSVDGTLTGVRVFTPTGDGLTIDNVVLHGESTAATATLTVSIAEAESLAEEQFKAHTTLAATVKVAAPDKVTITINGQSKPGHLVVRDGSLLMVPESTDLPTVTLLQTGSGNPFHLTKVSVGASALTLGGMIDLQSLLGL
ncbi:MAG TPA: hypothetical protein VF337_11200 [Candidatus Limnocylindrales bacterium]